MKLISLTLAAIAISVTARSQVYGGFAFSYSNTRETVYNYNIQHEETINEPTIGISFPAGYYHGILRIESGFTYNGAVYIPLNAGIALGDQAGVELLAGINDQLLYSKHPLQVVHHFPWNVKSRIKLGIVYLELEYLHENSHGSTVTVRMGMKSH